MIDDQDFEPNKFSDLYIACLKNDLDSVRALLTTLSFEQINSSEINGDTALHIAVKCGHINIVRLLLHDFGVFRHLKNKQNQTAYELAQTDEMRQLFQRPTSDGNRFCDETIFSLHSVLSEMDANGNRPSNYVQIHDNFISVRNHHAENVYPHHDNLFRRFFAKIFSRQPIDDPEIIRYAKILSTFIDEHISIGDTQYRKAKTLIEDYSKTGKIEPLIRLYTLETPFYKHINQNKESSDCLSSPIFNGLHSLHSRAFTGRTYRGLATILEEVDLYRSIMEEPKRFLITNTFCSTTQDEEYARGLAQARAHEPKKPVLMIFNFVKRCLTAIRLNKISDQLPCISEMEVEDEVLVLPGTTFLVDSIKFKSPIIEIYLEHCSLDEETGQYTTMRAYNLVAYD